MKKSIYPEPDPPITVVETSTELERQVGAVRRIVQDYTRDAFQATRHSIDRVVDVENKVESECK